MVLRSRLNLKRTNKVRHCFLFYKINFIFSRTRKFIVFRYRRLEMTTKDISERIFHFFYKLIPEAGLGARFNKETISNILTSTEVETDV